MLKACVAPAVDLVLERDRAARPARPPRRVRGGLAAKAGPMSGRRPSAARIWSAIDRPRSTLCSVRSGASISFAVPASCASRAFCSRSDVNTGVSSSSPTTTPAWRAAIVQPPCSAGAERPRSADLGQRRDGQAEAGADRAPAARRSSRGTRPASGRARPGRPRSRSSPASILVRTSGRRLARQAREQRRDRHHGHREAGDRRLLPPALDQQQHEQEECRRQGGGDQAAARGWRGRADARPRPRTSVVRGSIAGAGVKTSVAAISERRRHLHDEDRLPGEGAGQHAAERRADRRARDSGRSPERDRALVGAFQRHQLLERRR